MSEDILPPEMKKHRLQCPRCGQQTGILQQEHGAQTQEDILEGLAGTTQVQCQSCLYDWNIVTHRQVLQSLSLWSRSAGGGETR